MCMVTGQAKYHICKPGHLTGQGTTGFGAENGMMVLRTATVVGESILGTVADTSKVLCNAVHLKRQKKPYPWDEAELARHKHKIASLDGLGVTQIVST